MHWAALYDARMIVHLQTLKSVLFFFTVDCDFKVWMELDGLMDGWVQLCK